MDDYVLAVQILLVEPYFGGSHQAWADGLGRFSSHDVHVVSMPARFWKWRLAGGALTLAALIREHVAEHGPPDLVLATSMVNLPTLLGLAPDLSAVPLALYMHENQLGYPVSPKDKPDLTYPMINWLSTVAADHVFFNSDFHLEAWYEELPRMLKGFPDFKHLDHIDAVRERSSVLPVGVDLSRFDDAEPFDLSDGPPIVLWNQRWDHDKNPQGLFEALNRLKEPFRLALLGENFNNEPDEFRAVADRYDTVQFGFAEPGDYERWLKTADIVVSTAHQEYFGIAVVEAIYAGCVPVLPKRLSYPWLIPEAHHEELLYDSDDELVMMLEKVVAHPAPPAGLAAAVERFDWPNLIERYDDELERVTRLRR